MLRLKLTSIVVNDFIITPFIQEKLKGFELSSESDVPKFSGAGHTVMYIQLDVDRILYKRSVYSLYDFLSDIGGILGSLTFIFRSISNILIYKGVYFFLTPELFTVKKKRNKRDKFL